MVAPIENKDGLVIEAAGLTKVFKDFWGRPKARAVNGIDLNIRRGQVFGLLGPNGSGKSTTVKMILGLLYPTRGTLKVLGESPQDVAIKRRIGYLPEESYLYRYLTAAETLDFFGSLFGLVPAERRQRTDQLLDMVGLANSRNRPVGEFSKGMQRRIGMGQALINDPDLVILDEPTSGLDPIGCREVKDVIRLIASRGKTVVLCSHLLSDVEDVCDEVAVLYGGKIRVEGPLKEILAVHDRTRIEGPRLDPAVVEDVLALLRSRVPGAEVRVDHPRMTLENFFLDVVRRAKEASVETAGAQAGGQIAGYLRGQDNDQVAATAAVLAALNRDAVPAASGSAADAKAEGDQGAPVPAVVDTTKLAGLTGVPAQMAPATAADVADSTAAAAPKVTDAEASKRLAELLGGEGAGDKGKKKENK
ncbi:MAG: ABC transporter ATP-binding protein [Lentisphaerae bacterium RIFOXYB12_FULL_65_16]|nr:MAG: ABC transporter ATP-binding protein [Lentisphaerae bacterium RIFOXYA12_64_32]OGV90143.1 MAG: ABC transporter ATP-binding protein [Lentisphaerae bacterium RIFOXYB12_FULL_65_16]